MFENVFWAFPLLMLYEPSSSFLKTTAQFIEGINLV